MTAFVGPLLSWVLGPAGKVILLVLAFTAWTVYQRVDATRDCEAAELKRELLETQRQLSIANDIARDARERADKTALDMVELEKAYADLEAETGGDDRCVIDPDTRERLLRIR